MIFGGGVKPGALAVRARLVALAIALCGAFLLVIPQPTALVESRETTAQIDFDALHAQAKDALTMLQLAHERRIAGVIVEEF
jgi:hypothetical protein